MAIRPQGIEDLIQKGIVAAKGVVFFQQIFLGGAGGGFVDAEDFGADDTGAAGAGAAGGSAVALWRKMNQPAEVLRCGVFISDQMNE